MNRTGEQVHKDQKVLKTVHKFSNCNNSWQRKVCTRHSKGVCERALRIACKDSGSNSVNKSLTIHQRNLQLLAIEIFKTKNNINPTFMKDVFAEKYNYNSLRNPNHLQLPTARTTIYGTENIQFRGCSLWSSLPNSLKDSDTLQEFKKKIKQWNRMPCNCRMCKVYIKDLGFLAQFCIYILLFLVS